MVIKVVQKTPILFLAANDAKLLTQIDTDNVNEESTEGNGF